MDVGFETIGNAILVCHDRGPVLVTDPWITGTAYFGSWGLSHNIPEEILSNIKRCSYVWVSHGHPDHLSSRSLDMLQDKEILLPEHVGGLIHDGLTERGFKVHVLKDCVWVQLSDRIRVMCIADYNQDAILLVDINGRLIVDMNDADDHGWGAFVRRIIRQYPVSFVLHLAGFGDTDMINFYSEDASFIVPRAAKKRPVGKSMANWAHQWGTRYTIPFSSMHSYQRTDSIWADKYKTQLSDYPIGWDSRSAELLPAFIRYSAQDDSFEEINPEPNLQPPLEPEHFGDSWSEPMQATDKEKITNYFKAISHLETFLDFIRVRFGGIEHVVELGSRTFHRGLTFDAPRHSFMTSIEYEIFDDMLIGNFMRVTLHGRFGARPLYPDFNPYVTKYGDNGKAKSPEQLAQYFAAYRTRYPLGYLKHRIENKAVETLRYALEEDGTIYRTCAKSYHWFKCIGTAKKKSDFTRVAVRPTD